MLGVLPFGNVVFTVTINGAELKQFLENGVSEMPAANGKFPQVSGLCFTYDVAAPVGSRVTSAVRQAADGSCTGAAVDLTAASTYKIAENDFMATGGDGYPNVYARGTTQNLMDEVVAEWVTANSPLSPTIQVSDHLHDERRRRLPRGDSLATNRDLRRPGEPRVRRPPKVEATQLSHQPRRRAHGVAGRCDPSRDSRRNPVNGSGSRTISTTRPILRRRA